MVLKKTKLKNNKIFLLITKSTVFKKLLNLIKKYYLILLFVVSLLIFLYYVPRIFFQGKNRTSVTLKSIPKYVLISYNKILYTSKSIRNKNLLDAINSYENGYMEKAKFLFNAVLNNKELNKKTHIAAFVNLANIFDDENNYSLAVKYLNNALKLNYKDFIIHHNLGIIYKHKKNYKKAINHLKLAIKYNKNFVKSYLSIAAIFFYLKKYQESFNYYSQALAINPESYIAQYNSAVVLLKLNKETEAVEQFQKLIKNIQTEVKIRAFAAKILGAYFAKKGDYEKSLHYYKIASEYYQDFDIFYKIGMIYKFKGEYEKALDNLKKAYVLNKKNQNVIENLAKLYYQFGDMDTALKYYNYLLKTSENKSKLFLMVGEISYKKGYLQDAIDNYLKALSSSLSPDEAKIAYINLGNIYFKLQDYEQSLYYYKKAFNLDKTDANLYYNMGLLYVEKKDFQKAIDILNKGLNINPDNLNINMLIPKIYLLNNKKKKAVLYFRDLIEKHPDNYMLYFEIANLFYSLRKYDDALRYYKKLEKLVDKKNINTKLYLNMGILFLKKNNVDKALEYLNKAYINMPMDGLVNYNLGLLEYKMKNYDVALKYLRTVLRLNVSDDLKASVYLTMGNIFYNQHKYNLAKEEYRKAIKYNSGMTEAYFNLKIAEKITK